MNPINNNAKIITRANAMKYNITWCCKQKQTEKFSPSLYAYIKKINIYTRSTKVYYAARSRFIVDGHAGGEQKKAVWSADRRVSTVTAVSYRAIGRDTSVADVASNQQQPSQRRQK